MLCLLLGGCLINTQPTAPPPPPLEVPTTLLPQYLVDQNPVVAGICFEAALDAAGRTFVIRSEQELRAFFDLADHSRLCRRNVQRRTMDFSGGRVLVGLWNTGIGCTARHDVVALQRDDEAKTLTITLDFIAEGMCPYELVRPFWISIDGVSDYVIAVEVDPPEQDSP